MAKLIKLQRVIIFAVMVASNPVLVKDKFAELLDLVEVQTSQKIGSVQRLCFQLRT